VLNHSLNQLILQKYKTKNRLHKKSQPNKLGFYKFYFSLNSIANFNLSILASIFLISACKSRILLSLFAKSLFALSVSFKSFAVFLDQDIDVNWTYTSKSPPSCRRRTFTTNLQTNL
jgi:hypothetical protein